MRGRNEMLSNDDPGGSKRWIDLRAPVPAPLTPRPDFLRQDARTPWVETFHVAGVRLSIATNCESILGFARELFGGAADLAEGPSARLRLWVDPSADSGPPWPKPQFRGMSRLVFGGLDAQNSFLINLRTCSAHGRFSPALAADAAMWKTVILPVMFLALAPVLGLTLLHCACVAHEGRAFVLAGASGAGKSTLAIALAQSGFSFLSDDRTLVSLDGSRLAAWSVLPYAKIRREARRFFASLRDIAPAGQWGHEDAAYVDPGSAARLSAEMRSEPVGVFFLERQSSPEFSVAPISSGEVARRLELGLPQETPDVLDRQRQVIAALSKQECWVLRYGGNPHEVAQSLKSFVLGEKGHGGTPAPDEAQHGDLEVVARPDPLRRFTPTPFVAQLAAMDRVLNVATNNPAILASLRQLFDPVPSAPPAPAQFNWRIISEADGDMEAPWPPMTAFSGPGLRFINFGRRSFVAVDMEAREAAGVLRESWALDEPGLVSIFIPALFYLCAPSLGLTPITAACVAHAGRGILIFGEPGSGKTSSSYFAKHDGLEFHADQSAFLEFDGRELLAWGDFWPATFRESAEEYFPDLRARARIVNQTHTRFLTLAKSDQPERMRPAKPEACIFLERGASDSPRFDPLPQLEFAQRLESFIPFKEEEGFESERQRVFRFLGELPAFRLRCRKPSEAARFYRHVFELQQLLERRA